MGNTPTHRRRWMAAWALALVGWRTALAQAESKAATRDPTPRQFEGPYYPTVPIPITPYLLAQDASADAGTPMWITGRVLDVNSRPLSGVQVQLWQADQAGLYRHPKAPNTEKVHPSFAGFAEQTTDNEGRYRFRTIIPVPYTGRVPHIHAKLIHRGQSALVTQIYLRGKEKEEGMFFSLIASLYGSRDRLVIDPVRRADGQHEAAFDFVI